MIRAVFFDFYSVWTPDKLSYYLAYAELNGPEVYKATYDELEKYYHGQISTADIAGFLRVKLGHPDISEELFLLSEANISSEIISFIQSLHAHFLKIGILANLGNQELKLLNSFNDTNKLFEVIASPLSYSMPNSLLNRDVFVKALGDIGEPPESCLVVSGNPYYLEFAANFGIQTLQFEGLPQLKTAIDKLLQS